jgi:hypothetical protein
MANLLDAPMRRDANHGVVMLQKDCRLRACG